MYFSILILAFPSVDVCLKESVGIADSLYNLRLIRAFCERSLVMKCFHFTFEDLLYGRENLHDNVIVFVAEIFFLLEAADRGDGRMGTISESKSQHFQNTNLLCLSFFADLPTFHF